jgi:hypothetical protein
MGNVRELLGRLRRNEDALGAVPFSRFDGVLKQIQCADLAELELLALNFAFPLFLGRHPLLKKESTAVENELRGAGYFDHVKAEEVSPFCRRRFSGDASAEFPRGRYSALCLDDTGQDNGTLICELNGYALPGLTGYAAARSGPSEDSIEIVFRGLPGEPNPFWQAFRNPDLFDHVYQGLPADPMPLKKAATNPQLLGIVSEANEQSFKIRCSIERQEIETCLDLRQPEARRWTVGFFKNPPEGLYGDALKALSIAHNFELDRVADWTQLLPVIGSRNIGGNSLTDIFGAYLRSQGCEALIYPSTRNDYSATFVGGKLVEHFGWNLVDYRGAATPERVALEFGDPIEHLAGENVLEEITTGSRKGSIFFTGNLMVGQVVNQMLLEQHIKLKFLKWQENSGNREFFMRGYFWYKKKYGMSDRLIHIVCDRCGSQFTKPQLQVSSQCDSCGYAGDQ